MKKMKYLLAFSSALLMLVGCTEKEVVISSENELTAIFSPDTRTSYTYNSGTNFSWDTNDEIAIMLDDRTIVKGTLTPYSDPTRAGVTYPGGTRAYHAIYPYSMFEGGSERYGWYYSGYETRDVSFPNFYDISDIVAGNGTGSDGKTYETCQLPMYAANIDGNNKLLFKHFGDLLRVECNDVPSGTKCIGVSASKSLSGRATFWFDSDGVYKPGYSDWGGNGPVYYKIGTLSQETDGIVLNLPFFRTGDEYDPILITSYNSDNINALSTSNIVRMVFVPDWPVTVSSVGNGYKRTVSMSTNYDPVEGAYLEIPLGGGTASGRVSISAGSYSNMQYLTSPSLYCFGAVYSSTSSYPEIQNYADYIAIFSSATAYYANFNLSDVIKNIGVPTKIGIRYKNPGTSDHSMILGINKNSTSSQTAVATYDMKELQWSFPSETTFTNLKLNSNSANVRFYAIRLYY